LRGRGKTVLAWEKGKKGLRSEKWDSFKGAALKNYIKKKEKATGKTRLMCNNGEEITKMGKSTSGKKKNIEKRLSFPSGQNVK